MRRRRLKVYFDGGCRPNPGKIEVAIVARGVAYVFDDLGNGANNDAEWLALIHALQLAQSLGEPEFELVGDSALVINQANGLWKCRGATLQAHLDRFTALAAAAPPARIRWIGRAQNLAGIVLASRHER
jgi:ribonuclease HI